MSAQSLGRKFGAGVFAVIAIGVTVDRAMNYTKQNGVITSATVDCYIKSSDSEVVQRGNDKRAYMSCDSAPAAARKYSMAETDIKKRTKITYQYVSPVDQKTYTGSYDDEPSNHTYHAGEVYTVLAHKKNPEMSKWDYETVPKAPTGMAAQATTLPNASAVKGLRGKL